MMNEQTKLAQLRDPVPSPTIVLETHISSSLQDPQDEKKKKEDLMPGATSPARLITALQEGASRKPGVFLADKYLRQLERDFSEDLLIDNRDALVWLDNINDTIEEGL